MILQPGERAKWLIKMLDDGSVNVQSVANLPECFTACLGLILECAQRSGQPARFVEDLLDAVKCKLAADTGEKRLSREELLKMLLEAYDAGESERMNCPWCSGFLTKAGSEHDEFCKWPTVDKETAEVPA